MKKYKEYGMMSKELEALLEDEKINVENVKEYFKEIEDDFDFSGISDEVQSDVLNYLQSYNNELSEIQNAYNDEFEKTRMELEEFLYTTYGEEGAQIAEKIGNPYEISQAELERELEEIRKQIDEKNKEEAERIEQLNNLTEKLIITAAIVACAEETKKVINNEKLEDGISMDL